MEFDQFAGKYEQILDQSIAVSGEDSAYFAEYKAQYLKRLMTPSFAGKALDFGCGVGMLSAVLKRHLPGIQLDGFDVSAESIQKIDPQLATVGLFTSTSSSLAHDYDLIVVANVMHHVPLDDRQTVVRNLAGRLTQRGRLVIFEHNPANPATRWVVEHCPFDDDAVLLRPAETSSYFAKSNLRLLRRDYIVFMPRLLSWLRPIEPSLSWLPMGAQYAMVAERHV